MTRSLVDPGSAVYVDYMKNVPVCGERDTLTAPGDKHSAIYPSSDVGKDINEVVDEQDDSDSEDDNEDMPKKRNYPKRGSGRALFRQPSTTDSTLLGHNSV